MSRSRRSHKEIRKQCTQTSGGSEHEESGTEGASGGSGPDDEGSAKPGAQEASTGTLGPGRVGARKSQGQKKRRKKQAEAKEGEEHQKEERVLKKKRNT